MNININSKDNNNNKTKLLILSTLNEEKDFKLNKSVSVKLIFQTITVIIFRNAKICRIFYSYQTIKFHSKSVRVGWMDEHTKVNNNTVNLYPLFVSN